MPTHLGKTLILLTATALASACGGGNSDTSPQNSPPVASFTLTPSSGTAPLTVQQDASASTDTGAIAQPPGAQFGADWSLAVGDDIQATEESNLTRPLRKLECIDAPSVKP
jgi:hypothetical protein